MLKAHVLSPLDDQSALQTIFGATLEAFSEIAGAPADIRLTIGHYHRLRSLKLTRLEAAYLVAAASGVVADPGIERQLHPHVVALREFAACPLRPNPRVTRHWSFISVTTGGMPQLRCAKRRTKRKCRRCGPASPAPDRRGASPAPHALRHAAATRLQGHRPQARRTT